MSDLLIHGHTQRLVDGYVESPTQAILLTGPKGVGKGSLAYHLAEQALSLENTSFKEYAYGLRVLPDKDKTSIGIEKVRELEQFLALKVPRTAAYNRGVIIENADMLTTEAQNALLKTLEEPPEGTVLILTATHQKALLPTIISRVQTIPVQRPEKSKITAHFAQKFPDASIDQKYAISGGLPGLLHSLLEDDEHPLLNATESARGLLQQTTYERLLQVDMLAKDKGLAADTVYILQQMAHVSLQSATGSTAKKWQGILKASHEATEALQANAQPKLVLTNLMLQL